MDTKTVDLRIENGGTLFLFTPISEDARCWLENNVQTEPWQWFGGALAVEHRYAGALAQAAMNDGLAVE